MSEQIRVLVVEDQQLLRATFRMLIENEPDMVVVGEAADGREAVTAAQVLIPDVVLIDVQMPGMDGLDATEALCSAADGPRVVVLTMFDRDEYIFRALRAGASGFLLKNSPPADVTRAVREAHAGNATLAPEVVRKVITPYVRPANETRARLKGITERERETLTLVARGLSNEEIAAELFVTHATVRTYVSRLLTKLQARSRAQLVVAAYESGLVRA